MSGWTQGVCLSVCVCVCLCVCLSVSALQPKRLGRFWWNFTQIVSRTWASVVFLRFWISQFDDVMAAILHFSRAALSRSQFWSDFVQIWTQCSLMVSRVCYWKLAKSVGNFRRYGRPRFRKKIQNDRQKQNFRNRASEVSISTNSDPLITKMTIFCRFDKKFPRKMWKF